MQLISDERTKFTPSYCKKPLSDSMDLPSSSENHSGCVKSPVPSRSIPLIFAHFESVSSSMQRLVAREYFECMCRSAMTFISSPVFRTAMRKAKPPGFQKLLLCGLLFSTKAFPADGPACARPLAGLSSSQRHFQPHN